MSRPEFMGSAKLATVLADLSIKCLDIGARGGFTEDLIPLGRAVQACGFEPDQDECTRLNQAAAGTPHPWGSLIYFPVGLAATTGTRPLNVYRNRDCSSLLEADVDLAQQFSRDHYFTLDGVTEVPVLALDEAAQRYDFADAAYIKLDVQGAELEILSSGPTLLGSNVLAVRTEVEFVPLYHGQPLYTDVDRCLREHGLVPMRFLEMRHWRRDRRGSDDPRAPLPFSRAQLVHADMLFLRDPNLMDAGSADGTAQLLKLAFLAMAHGHVDLAEAIIERSEVAAVLRERYGFNAQAAIREVASHLGREERRARMKARWQRLRRAARASLPGMRRI